MLDDPIQMETTITCGPFKLHFYENLFFPNESSKLHSYKNLTDVVLETIINELFTLDLKTNE